LNQNDNEKPAECSTYQGSSSKLDEGERTKIDAHDDLRVPS
jgi:hypothetical protein